MITSTLQKWAWHDLGCFSKYIELTSGWLMWRQGPFSGHKLQPLCVCVCVCVCIHSISSLSQSEPDTPERVRREVGGYDYFPPLHPLILTPYSQMTLLTFLLPTCIILNANQRTKNRGGLGTRLRCCVLIDFWFYDRPSTVLMIREKIDFWFYDRPSTVLMIREKCWGRHSCRYWAQMRDQGHNG